MPLEFLLIWMEFKGYRFCIIPHQCPCTDPNCADHRPPQYFK